jgi:uncharacterized protein YndB with AHSA1/START domain
LARADHPDVVGGSRRPPESTRPSAPRLLSSRTWRMKAMAQVEATTQRTIAADPERVFEALADYSRVRPRILTEHYSEYEVQDGGTGAGTTVHWRLQATSKRVRDCLLHVTQPSPGQLVEKDANSSMVTTWTVTPAGEGNSRVVVETTWTGAGGIGGFFEKTFAPKGLNRIQDGVLDNLASVAQAETGE